MLNNIMNVVYLLTGVFALFIMPALLTQDAMKFTNGMVRRKGDGKLVCKKLSGSKVLLSWIPLWQMVELRKVFYNGRSVPTVIAAIFPPIAIVFRLVVVFLLTPTRTLLVVSSILVILSMIIVWILYAAVIVDVGSMTNCSMMKLVLCAIFPFGAAVFVRLELPYMFKDYKESKRMEAEYGS